MQAHHSKGEKQIPGYLLPNTPFAQAPPMRFLFIYLTPSFSTENFSPTCSSRNLRRYSAICLATISGSFTFWPRRSLISSFSPVFHSFLCSSVVPGLSVPSCTSTLSPTDCQLRFRKESENGTYLSIPPSQNAGIRTSDRCTRPVIAPSRRKGCLWGRSCGCTSRSGSP